MALAACVEAVLALRLWRADLRVPFNYRGDSVFFAMMVKAVIDHGWYLTNAQLGAPGVLALHDFPQADGIHLLLIKLLSWFSADWALLFNIYYLLGFPLIALSAFAVLRHFRVAPGPAFVASLLYAFLPSRLMVGELHFYLVAFYQVPLAILLALWVAGDDPPLFAAPGGARGGRRFALRRGRSVAAIAIALLISGTGVYYAFFAGVLILFSGAWSAVERRSPRHALAGLAITALIVAGLTVQSIPTLLYHRAMGPNPAAATRPLVEAETYGLRIAPMLLPVRDHRIAALSAVSYRYAEETGIPGEVASTNLGAVGAVGFLLLLGLLVRRGRAAGADREPLFSALARLNLAALLLATTGGFGALFALLVSPQIRTYARMHVYIAFFAPVLRRAAARSALAHAAPRGCPVDGGGRVRRALRPDHAGHGAAVRASARAPTAPTLRSSIRSRRGFRRARRSSSCRTCASPRAGRCPGTKLVDYDPLRPYLHSRALRWSYPTMFGRLGDAWTNAVADQPVPEMVRTLSDVGFEGILVDRDGYADDGAAIVAALAAELGADSGEQATDRQVFFSLRAANEKAGARASANVAGKRR